jgi:hypothetical protein
VKVRTTRGPHISLPAIPLGRTERRLPHIDGRSVDEPVGAAHERHDASRRPVRRQRLESTRLRPLRAHRGGPSLLCVWATHWLELLLLESSSGRGFSSSGRAGQKRDPAPRQGPQGHQRRAQ